MDNPFNKMADYLPDVWFDWYARLIPGCFGLGLFLLINQSTQWLPKIPPTATGVFIFLFTGYIIGHLLQPFSGAIVKHSEKAYGKELIYAIAKKKQATRASSLKKVSKAHSEANSMFSCTLFIAINAAYLLRKWVLDMNGLSKIGTSDVVLIVLLLIAMFYCLWATLQRIGARNRKILDL